MGREGDEAAAETVAGPHHDLRGPPVDRMSLRGIEQLHRCGENCKTAKEAIIEVQLYLVGGSFGLREFAQIRYDVHKLHGKAGQVGLSIKPNGDKLRLISLWGIWNLLHLLTMVQNHPSPEALHGNEPFICAILEDFEVQLLVVDPALKEKLKQNTVTLESEYEKLKGADLDNWENIRGPRLWEDSRTVQQQRREAARLKRE
ncbi:cytochrome c oxidase assembly protein COX16-like protein [Columba livia]|nr:cytochrome c oxidase assembly protein COX16-like protein [Columba livia]